MNKIILASSNQGKIREINQLLKGHHIMVIPQSEQGVEEVEETGATFIENALLKARHAAKLTQLPTLADDSGLVVPALQGEPGIYSARYSGARADASSNINKLLTKMQHLSGSKRDAYFYCIIVLISHANDPCPVICEGRWDGKILAQPQGDKGFGYDPIFYDPHYQLSAAELEPEVKNQVSHRGQAMKIFLRRIAELTS